MYSIYGTRRLLRRLKARPVEPVAAPSTLLGNWYVHELSWQPGPVALFVNERTRLPVFVPINATDPLVPTFVDGLGDVLAALEVPRTVIVAETRAMAEWSWAAASSHSYLGTINDYAYSALLEGTGARRDLTGLAVRIARSPRRPFRDTTGTPAGELARVVRARPRAATARTRQAGG